MALGLADTQGLCERDVVMPVVPMFHVNAWGLPFAATWFGSTIVRRTVPGTVRQSKRYLPKRYLSKSNMQKCSGV